MTVNLHTFAQMYGHALDTLDAMLTKGAAHAVSQGVSEAEMLDWRLIQDMNPLSFQVATVCNFTRNWSARAVGQAVAPDVPTTLDLAGYRAAIADAKAYLADLAPEAFADRDETPLTVSIGPMEPTLPASRWISVFATTNVYFHVSMVYAILRSRGVALGKRDMFAAGL